MRWSRAEDALLIDALADGSNVSWPDVAMAVPCRTDSQCRRRWILLERRRSFNGRQGDSWTMAECEQLLLLVMRHGKKWKRLTVWFEGRSAKELQQKYLNLQPSGSMPLQRPRQGPTHASATGPPRLLWRFVFGRDRPNLTLSEWNRSRLQTGVLSMARFSS